MKRAGLSLLLLLLTTALAQAQCWTGLSPQVRQKRMYEMLTAYWVDKPDTISTAHFRIEKPAYTLKLLNRDDSPVYDSIELRINEMILCGSKSAEAWFVRNKSAAHRLILTRLRQETDGADVIDSLYYQYEVGDWKGFADRIMVPREGGGRSIDLATLETVYRFRKDWFLNYGPDLIAKSDASQEDKEQVAEMLCRLGQCQYQEQMMDSRTPNFR